MDSKRLAHTLLISLVLALAACGGSGNAAQLGPDAPSGGDATATVASTRAAGKTPEPGPERTEEPTSAPTEEPTSAPTEEPTSVPTATPTATEEPTTVPTATPTASPLASTDPGE